MLLETPNSSDDWRKRIIYMYLHKNEFSVFFFFFFSLVRFVLLLNLPDNEQSSAFVIVQPEKEYYVYFLFLLNKWLRNKKKWNPRKAAMGTWTRNFTSSSLFFLSLSFLFTCLHIYWEIQVAVQIYKINFHSYVYETIHERQLVCLHIENNKGTISFVYSTFVWLCSIIDKRLYIICNLLY